MKLVQFDEVIKFDNRVSELRGRMLKLYRSKGSVGDKLDLFRTKMRRKIKMLADYTCEFSGGNGQSNFVDWQDGFKFATSLPPDTEVVKCVRYDQSINAAFFYRQKSIDATYTLLKQLELEFEELKKLVGIFEVMNS